MRIGTVGSGPIVKLFLDAVAKTEGAECGAIYSRSIEKGRELANSWPVPAVYDEYAAMLADESIDTIYIASPNSLHAEQARQAMLAGKHVICEKPLASNRFEAESIVQLARQTHRFLFEAITTVHFSGFEQLKDDLPLLGSIRLVQANYSQYSSRYDLLMAGQLTNIFDPAYSGGALMDINVYNVHFAVGLFGAPIQVQYMANRAANGIDTSGILTLGYDEFCCVLCGAKDSGSPSSALIQGTRGYVRTSGPVQESLDYEGVAEGRSFARLAEPLANRMMPELADFVRVLSKNDWETTQAWQDHSLMVMAVLDKARKSAGIVFPADPVSP